MQTSSQVREAFLAYFQKNGHTRVESSPLVPYNDPTLMFTNAGMNQFKEVFTGRERREYRRATSSQKCVRAGGKHNDLENVGRTARHHTFFEMLGNFSFGDYFKEDAIRFAWDLLTRELGIPAQRLAFTVFRGDSAMKLPPDDEARALWTRIAGVPESRVLGLSAQDNFWQMGDTGPCGPCSEIHFQQGDDLPCAEERAGRPCQGPACDCDRWLEIWNLVFMQFERDPQGVLSPLPAPSVDTGMGLERLCAVLQGKRSNYETDLFVPLIDESARLAGKRFDAADYQGPSVSLRAIADHARATAFLMADGVMPEKTGREYVLRRIMRRGIYHGWLLGIHEPFLHRLADQVITSMKAVYPELVERRSTILEMTQVEERRFRETLDRGLKILEDEFARMSRSGAVVPGEVAFRLYDTFGFPLDLTEVIATSHGASVDEAGYKAAMEEQRRKSTFTGSGEESVDQVWQKVRAEVGATEFLGYDAVEAEGTVLRVLGRGRDVAEAGPGPVAFVTDRSPFYGEQGGQIGDTGEAFGPAGLHVRVTDTRKPGGDLTVHLGEVVAGSLARGTRLRLVVDAARRDAIRKNHSATHLVHWALRKVLGEHVAQKGSVVAPDRLRFDFSHTRPLADAERRQVEALVNERIWRNEPVSTDVLAIEDARKRGAIAFFGDKYGDRVRVVQMAESQEFCGGTHVRATGDIGLFKIVEETGIAQGVRRIVAVTGRGALEYVQRLEAVVGEIAERVKAGPADVVEKVDKLSAELRARDKQLADLQRKLAAGGTRDLLADVREVGGVRLLATRTDVADAKALRDVGDQLRDKLGSGVLVLAGVADGKVALLAMVTKDLVERFSAGEIVKQLAPLVGGRGGGRPDMAQAGGSQPEGVDAALLRAAEIVAGS
jgi:alanyl-tRNA synthetase